VTRSDEFCVPRCRPLLYTDIIYLLAWTILAILLWPLINELFSSTGLPMTGCFWFLAPFSINLSHCRVWKLRRPDVFEGLEPTRLRSLVLHILTFNRTVTEYIDAHLPVLYSKPRPRFHERGCVTNKLSAECIFGDGITQFAWPDEDLCWMETLSIKVAIGSKFCLDISVWSNGSWAV
jgi:hypothetical protein